MSKTPLRSWAWFCEQGQGLRTLPGYSPSPPVPVHACFALLQHEARDLQQVEEGDADDVGDGVVQLQQALLEPTTQRGASEPRAAQYKGVSPDAGRRVRKGWLGDEGHKAGSGSREGTAEEPCCCPIPAPSHAEPLVSGSVGHAR